MEEQPEAVEQMMMQEAAPIPEEVSGQMPNEIDAIMEATALPANDATHFIQANAEEGIDSLPRDADPPANLEALVAEVDTGKLFVRMMNEGNFIEMAAEVARQQGQGVWSQLATQVLAVQENEAFHTLRSKILRPLGGTEPSELQQAVNSAKNVIAKPAGVDIDEISWDAVSFKVLPSAAEFFCHKYPAAVELLSDADLKVIDDIQGSCERAIREKAAEFRARTNTRADEFVTDLTLFLEQQIGGSDDSYGRQQRIAKIGRGVLLQYIEKMQNVFLSGNLPSSIQPAKIYACHDVITAAELRGSIMKIAEQQVVQQSNVLPNQNVMKKIYYLSEENRNFTHAQAASVLLRKNVDVFGRQLMASLGESYDQPMKNLEHHLAGSANSLGQQLEAATGDIVVQQNEEQKELAKQQLSVLLACLRLRANAVQQSDWELMTEDDFDHLEIVRFLLHGTTDIGAGADYLYQLATALLESYSKGHNVVKFQGRMLPKELGDLITYTMTGRAKIIARQVKMFNEDIARGGQLFSMLLKCVMMAMGQKQRVQMEFSERAQRRSAGALVGQDLQ